MIDMIISSDPFLTKLSRVISWLKSTLEFNEKELKRVKTLIAEQGIAFNMDSSHLKNSLVKKFYRVILRHLKVESIESADNVIQTVFGEECPLSSIINGGLPFIDSELYQNISQQKRKKVKKLKNFQILDFMRNSELSKLTEFGNYFSSGGNRDTKRCLGNSNWLVWQRSLFLSLKASSFNEEKKLFGYLCSDFTSSCSGSDHEQEYGFDERFYELFRVRKNFLKIYF